MNQTKIEWTDYSWNPVTGCTRGCSYCYARRFAHRLAHNPTLSPETRGKYDGFRPAFWEERLNEPKRMKKPRRIFVCSMGDLFGGDVPAEWIRLVLKRAAWAPQHVYQFLTKNPPRMVEALEAFSKPEFHWWAGVTVEKNSDAYRVRDLLSIDRYVEKLFVSAEPLLAPLTISRRILERLDWVIAGPDTSKGCIRAPLQWFRALRDDCRAADVPFFYKGKDPPEDLRVQEFPA